MTKMDKVHIKDVASHPFGSVDDAMQQAITDQVGKLLDRGTALYVTGPVFSHRVFKTNLAQHWRTSRHKDAFLIRPFQLPVNSLLMMDLKSLRKPNDAANDISSVIFTIQPSRNTSFRSDALETDEVFCNQLSNTARFLRSSNDSGLEVSVWLLTCGNLSVSSPADTLDIVRYFCHNWNVECRDQTDRDGNYVALYQAKMETIVSRPLVPPSLVELLEREYGLVGLLASSVDANLVLSIVERYANAFGLKRDDPVFSNGFLCELVLRMGGEITEQSIQRVIQDQVQKAVMQFPHRSDEWKTEETDWTFPMTYQFDFSIYHWLQQQPEWKQRHVPIQDHDRALFTDANNTIGHAITMAMRTLSLNQTDACPSQVPSMTSWVTDPIVVLQMQLVFQRIRPFLSVEAPDMTWSAFDMYHLIRAVTECDYRDDTVVIVTDDVYDVLLQKWKVDLRHDGIEMVMGDAHIALIPHWFVSARESRPSRLEILRGELFAYGVHARKMLLDVDAPFETLQTSLDQISNQTFGVPVQPSRLFPDHGRVGVLVEAVLEWLLLYMDVHPFSIHKPYDAYVNGLRSSLEMELPGIRWEKHTSSFDWTAISLWEAFLANGMELSPRMAQDLLHLIHDIIHVYEDPLVRSLMRSRFHRLMHLYGFRQTFVMASTFSTVPVSDLKWDVRHLLSEQRTLRVLPTQPYTSMMSDGWKQEQSRLVSEIVQEDSPYLLFQKINRSIELECMANGLVRKRRTGPIAETSHGAVVPTPPYYLWVRTDHPSESQSILVQHILRHLQAKVTPEMDEWFIRLGLEEKHRLAWTTLCFKVCSVSPSLTSTIWVGPEHIQLFHYAQDHFRWMKSIGKQLPWMQHFEHTPRNHPRIHVADDRSNQETVWEVIQAFFRDIEAYRNVQWREDISLFSHFHLHELMDLVTQTFLDMSDDQAFSVEKSKAFQTAVDAIIEAGQDMIWFQRNGRLIQSLQWMCWDAQRRKGLWNVYETHKMLFPMTFSEWTETMRSLESLISCYLTGQVGHIGWIQQKLYPGEENTVHLLDQWLHGPSVPSVHQWQSIESVRDTFFRVANPEHPAWIQFGLDYVSNNMTL